MASGQPANVQAYLNKHKITQLFEELTALLAKELPTAPLDFLIQKLQMRKKKVSATSTATTRIPTSPATSKKKPLAVSGTGVGGTSRPATVATTATRKPAQEVRKPSSTDGASSKLSAGRTVGAKGVSPSKLKPPSDTKRPNTAPTRPAGGAGGASVSAGKRPGPTTSRPAAVTASSSRGSSSSSLPPPGRGKRPPGASSGSKVPARKKPETGKPPPTKTVQKPAAAAPAAAPPKSLPTIAVATPPLPTLSLAVDAGGDDDEEQIIEAGAREREYDSSGDYDEEEEEKQETKEELDFNLLLAQMRRSRQPKGRFLKQHLTTLLESESKSPRSVEEEEESDGESGLEMVEGASDLEEEGVVLSEEKKHLARKLPTAPLVSMQVIVCARCTRIISREDETSMATDSATAALQSSQTPTDEFESVSQVGSHVTFPQWESGPELTVHQKWMLSGKQPQVQTTPTQPLASDSSVTPESHPLIPLTDGRVDELLVDTSANDQEEVENENETQPGAGLSDTLIEFSSEDTWKGVAPLSRPLIPTTDEESDLLLPTPVDYQKEVDDEEVTPQPEDDPSDTLIEPSSEDTWKGITPMTRPLIPPSDEESELILPSPVEYQKLEEEEEEDEDVQTGRDDLSETLVESSSTDTWKGVTPTTRPLVPPSDEESELILPTPVDFQKEEGEEEEEDDEEVDKEDEEVENGVDDLSETLVEPASNDVWKGITPTPQVPFPTGDESDLPPPFPIEPEKEAEEEELMDWS